MERLLLTTSEAADVLGVSRDTVVRLIKAGRLPAVDVTTGPGERKRLRVRVSDVRRFVDDAATGAV